MCIVDCVLPGEQADGREGGGRESGWLAGECRAGGLVKKCFQENGGSSPPALEILRNPMMPVNQPWPIYGYSRDDP